MKALEIFNQGNLSGAIESATEFVKESPKIAGGREILAELLCFRGELERADKQLETIMLQNPDQAVSSSLMRQLIRAETARREVWNRGRVPEFLGEPGESIRQRLLAIVALRDGRPEEAAELIEGSELQRPFLGGICDETEFSDFRDLDDVCSSFFEVLTSTGKYYWIPMANVVSMEFAPPTRPRDLMWRQCEMEVANGPNGFVYIPVSYLTPELSEPPSPEIVLGRATDWIDGVGDLVRGLGQRMFVADDNDLSIMEMKRITFQATEKS